MVLFVEKPVDIRCTHDEARDDNDEIKVLEPVQIAVLLYGICVHARMHEYMYTGICVHERMHMRACAHA